MSMLVGVRYISLTGEISPTSTSTSIFFIRLIFNQFMISIIVFSLGLIAQATQLIGWRNNNIWGLIYAIGAIVRYSEATLWFNAVLNVVCALMCLFSWVYWNNPKMRYHFKIWHLGLCVVIFITMYGSLYQIDASPVMDSVSSFLILAATALASLRNKYGFLLYAIANAIECFMWLSIPIPDYWMASMQFIFFLSAFLGIYLWSKRKVHR